MTSHRNMSRIDHLVWGVRDLDEGVDTLTTLTGRTPVMGGAHPGNGTRNALLPPGHRCYFEVLAPDPAQDVVNTRGAGLLSFTHPRLLTFAVACDDIEASAARIAASGLPAPQIAAMSRTQPDGEVLRWRLAHLTGHTFGGLAPFLIDWGDTPHPSRLGPAGCSLSRLVLRHPDHERLATLLAALALDDTIPVDCEPGSAALVADLLTPQGPISLTSTSEPPPSEFFVRGRVQSQ